MKVYVVLNSVVVFGDDTELTEGDIVLLIQDPKSARAGSDWRQVAQKARGNWCKHLQQLGAITHTSWGKRLATIGVTVVRPLPP